MSNNKTVDNMVNVHSLSNLSLDYIINNISNTTEVLSSLWGQGCLLPEMIRKKKTRNLLEELLFSFHPKILTGFWGCPQEILKSDWLKNEYIDRYVERDLDDVLDDIILSNDKVDILNCHKYVLDLLDDRDKEICETKRYKEHFGEKVEGPGGFIQLFNFVRAVEGDYEQSWTVKNCSGIPHEPSDECNCGSEWDDDECYCSLFKTRSHETYIYGADSESQAIGWYDDDIDGFDSENWVW